MGTHSRAQCQHPPSMLWPRGQTANSAVGKTTLVKHQLPTHNHLRSTRGRCTDSGNAGAKYPQRRTEQVGARASNRLRDVCLCSQPRPSVPAPQPPPRSWPGKKLEIGYETQKGREPPAWSSPRFPRSQALLNLHNAGTKVRAAGHTTTSEPDAEEVALTAAESAPQLA